MGSRWWVATLFVAAISAIFVALGFWQLRRHDERRLEHLVLQARLAEDPLPLGLLIDAAGGDNASLEYRRASITGQYEPEGEVLVRGQAREGQPGFHVVTPFRLDDGRVVLVNRGWVPLALDTPPLAGAPPPSGPVALTGFVRSTQTRRGVGPQEPSGRLAIVARVDLDRLSGQMPGPLAPVWLQVGGEADAGLAGGLPVPLDAPSFTDAGPHLSYAIQWFSFAAIAIGGYVVLNRKRASGGTPR